MHVLVENELNELSGKLKAISTKGLTNDLINKFNILNIIVFTLAKKWFKYLVRLLELVLRNLKESQKKLLKI